MKVKYIHNGEVLWAMEERSAVIPVPTSGERVTVGKKAYRVRVRHWELEDDESISTPDIEYYAMPDVIVTVFLEVSDEH